MRLLVRRGFSLIELSVGMTLVLCFLAMSYFTLAQGVRYVKETDTYTYPQREVAVLLRKLSEELGNSHERWVIPGLSAASIRFLSAANLQTEASHLDFAANGKPIWKKWVCYAWNSANSNVTRYEVALQGAPVSDLTNEPDPNYLPDDFPTRASASGRVIARNIVDFKIVPSGTSQHTVTVTAEKQVPVSVRKNTHERARVTLQATIVILNQDT